MLKYANAAINENYDAEAYLHISKSAILLKDASFTTF